MRAFFLPVVEIFASQVSVAGGGFHLEDAVLDGQNRDIERTATQVEDKDVALNTNLGGKPRKEWSKTLQRWSKT